MIKIKNLQKSVRAHDGVKHLFHDLNLDVEDGQCVAILGSNGCGKSTLLNLITGIDNNYSGQIMIRGSLEKRASNVAYMQQKDLLLPWLTVEQNIRLGVDIQGMANKHTQTHIDDLLKKLSLLKEKAKYPTKLSGGERQKVALIRTLILDTPILLLDEPFSAIDFSSRRDSQKILISHIQQKKLTSILITHDIEEAVIISNRVIMLDHKTKGIKLDMRIELESMYRDSLVASQSSQFCEYRDIIIKKYKE